MSTTPFSIEFFPPQTPAGVDKLRATRAQLAQLQPDFFSVGDVERRPLESTRGQLNNSTVRVTVSGARALPIEDILTFVETAFEKDPSGLMFLSEFDLRPTPQGWQVRSLEFRRYSFNRNRQ